MAFGSDFSTNDRRLIHKGTHYFRMYGAYFNRWINRPPVLIADAARAKDFEDDQIAVRIGDQRDGSMADVAASFQHLCPHAASAGIYMVEDLMVEDLHTAYWNEYGGGLRREGNFIELCKSLIDFLNADHARNQLAATEFTKTTLSMHFYDSVAAFRRGRYIKKYAPQIGRS